MHWADVEAGKLIEKYEPVIIATGITPSGHIHVGNMREILTGDAVFRAVKDHTGEPTLLYIADTFDPLRKVYPFLPDSYSEYVGQPISDIPCPCGEHENYAEHFLEPFMKAVEQLGIYPVVKRVHEMYDEGLYAENIMKLIDKKEGVREILEKVSGRQLPKKWFPYTPKCSGCNTFSNSEVIDFTAPFVHYRCKCGAEDRSDIRKAQGKLPWRLEWPARWSFLGVTCEPFGKDHAASGGSYESGKEIIEMILRGSSPHPVVYEWIQLKGKGAMSSSSGVVISATDMLKMTPPQVLRFLVMRVDPPKHIDFDSGFGLLNLVDEYDRYEQKYFTGDDTEKDIEDRNRAFEFSQVETEGLKQRGLERTVSYRHLVSLVQIDPSEKEVFERVKRTEGITELNEDEESRLLERMRCVKYWVDNYSPASVRFSLKREFQELMVKDFGDYEADIIRTLLAELSTVKWDAEEIHQACYRVKEKLNVKPTDVFSLLYGILLNQKRGPRLGYFLSSLERDFITGRLSEALDNIN